MQRLIAVFAVFLAGFAAIAAAEDENSSILRHMADRLGNGVLANAYHAVPAVAIYEGQQFCFLDCQEFRQKFWNYLALPGRLPSLAEHTTIRWEWHIGQGIHKKAKSFYVLVYDRKTIKVWWARLKIDEDHEGFFADAVQLMEEGRMGERFHIFQLDPSSD